MDLSNLKQSDTASLTVLHPITGDDTNFVITFAGPGHAKTIALKNTTMRRVLKRSRSGKDELTPESIESDNLDAVVTRMLGWVGLKDGTKDVPFSEDHARVTLADPKFSWLRGQVNTFLAADASFMTGSVKA